MEPIACTLSPGALRQRAGDFAALPRLSSAPIAGGARVRYRRGAEARVRTLVAAEAECCSFLRFTVTPERDALRVDVTGPPEARPLIDELAQLESRQRTRSRSGPRS